MLYRFIRYKSIERADSFRIYMTE